MSKYARLFRRAGESVEYWTQLAMRHFVRDFAQRMDAEGLKRSELAVKIGSTPAYVTKILRGDANFTLETMTKLAMAVGGRLQIEIVDAGDVSLRQETNRVMRNIALISRALDAEPRSATAVTSGVIDIPLNYPAVNAWSFAGTVKSQTPTVEDGELLAA